MLVRLEEALPMNNRQLERVKMLQQLDQSQENQLK